MNKFQNKTHETRLMRTVYTRALVCILAMLSFIALVPGASLQKQQENQNSPDMEKACRNFVQQFYDWYVPKDKKGETTQSLESALKYKRDLLDPELFRLLKADRDAQAKSPGDLVGLDFDPFLNAQDNGERYIVGKVTPKGQNYLVEVFGIWNGEKSKVPDVTPEVAFRNGKWLFINFHYERDKKSSDRNLLSVLKSLAGERRKK